MSSIDHKQLLATYENDGVVRIPGFFDAAALERIRAALDRYIREVAPGVPAADRVLEADGKSVRNLWRMQDHDPFFAELAKHPAIADLVGLMVRGRPVLMAVESFCKPARVGSAVPHHQDNAYFCQCPPDVLTVWIALDRTSEFNGAVRYILGSHKRGLLSHQASLVAGNSIGLAQPPDASEPEFCAVLEPGDIVVHHSEVIHRSERNTSDRPRRGLLLVYRGEHTRTDPRLQAEYEAARTKLGPA